MSAPRDPLSFTSVLSTAFDVDNHRAVLDALPTVVWCVDIFGRCIYVNRQWEQFFGQPADAARDQGWLDVALAEHRSRVRESWTAALLAQAPFEAEYRVSLRGGLAGWAQHRAHPMHTAAGRLCGYLGVINDVTATKEAQLAAAEREAEVRFFIHRVPVQIAYFDAAQRCRFANDAYAEANGFSSDDLPGRTIREIMGEQAYIEVEPQVARTYGKSEAAVTFERTVDLADGSRKYFDVTLTPHLRPDGEPDAAFMVINDVTRYRAAEQAVRDSEERLRKFTDATREGIVFHDAGIVTDCNPALLRLLGREADEVIGQPILDFIAAEHHARVREYMLENAEYPYEVSLAPRNGPPIPIEAMGKTLPFAGRQHRLVVVRDIRDRKQAEERIQFLARHDALTGLPNRFALQERLEQVLATARRQRRHAATLFIDLDHFKTVNDSLGHHLGDVLLKTVALRIQALLRAADVVARLGGDEFLVVLGDLADENDAVPVAEKLLASVSEPIALEGNSVAVSPSIGISIFPRDGDSSDALIKNADAAMYLAKDRGRANFQFFSPRLSEAAFAALALESRLREATRNGEFELHFQPQVDVKTRVLSGVEALLRWRHPEQGLVIPERFIALAEQRGLIARIGAWALREACAQAMRWRSDGLAPITIAVNVSPAQLKQRDLVQLVERVLRDTGLPAGALEIELTESTLSDDIPQMVETLQALKQLGVRLALDDFGTGYSSLAHLKRLPLDRLKIDRSFVRDIPDDADDVAICAAIIDMGRNLGMSVIAEGVETEAQRAFLAERGCHEMQGYLIGPPLPAEAMHQFIAAAQVSSTVDPLQAT
jgi:diguanylate cyclase (GGDEF)-like protein/PAS domain S-box-containing protein